MEPLWGLPAGLTQVGCGAPGDCFLIVKQHRSDSLTSLATNLPLSLPPPLPVAAPYCLVHCNPGASTGVHILELPPCSCVTLGKLMSLSELQFPHWDNNASYPKGV